MNISVILTQTSAGSVNFNDHISHTLSRVKTLESWLLLIKRISKTFMSPFATYSFGPNPMPYLNATFGCGDVTFIHCNL